MTVREYPVSGICPVLETPFTADGEVDYPGFERLIDHLVGIGVRSVMYPGFASEFLKLSDAERDTLTTLLLDRTRDVAGFVAVISVPDHALKLAVDRARSAVRQGAGAINVLPPHQLGPSSAAVRQHVQEIARAVAPTPVVLQYAPAQTGTALDGPIIAEMAREFPNICQVKAESTPPGALISQLLEQTPALSSVVGYGGVQLIDALRRGAVGAQPGCSFTELYLQLWANWQAGREDQAIALHTRMLPYISYWMQGVELIIAAEKRISRLRGLIDSEHCRAPARALDAEEEAMIARFLREFEAELSVAGGQAGTRSGGPHE
ncbi:L-2-keto-3-deoxyarabonate dehydratase [Leucobacter sp. BZR 635]